MLSTTISKHGIITHSDAPLTTGEATSRLIQSPDFTKAVAVVRDHLKDSLADNQTANIAGGFCRDIVCGVPYSDVDVFVSDRRLFPKFTKKQHGKLYKFSSLIEYAIQREVSGLTLNLVLCRGTNLVIDGFNVGLSKIGYDVAHGQFRVDRDFIKDANNKSITVLNEDPSPERTTTYVNKIKEKYPKHTVVPFSEDFTEEDVVSWGP